MDVREAVMKRRSIRGFLDTPVSRATLERVLDTACRAPSGGNLQPWRPYLLTGSVLDQLKNLMAERLATGPAPDEPEYPIYPPGLTSPYRDRRFALGEQLYSALAVPREDKAGRQRQFARNYQLFGAPVGLFCYVDRQMGAAQWSDLGMYLQTVMLLLTAEGLACCPQEAWSIHHRTVAEIIQPPEELMLFCGMAIGYEDPDHPANNWRSERAPFAEVATFQGWSD
ncbi:NADH dehydrogenase [Streptomyces sp. MMG1533]|uniref:nitroreductase n=1 Tax=Streptomyces sp. MMG1533 TaxID=1415546 RepID=UPI0006AEF4C9|nr:nitroreductase [Streptomyces sp. MMG1533]KOU59827.1 NADH dehydrogenase [Streptomyces sp. MMG1533]